jgi:membrane protein required for colicin V production
MDFNHWDIILFLPLLFAAWKGFRKGLIVELASIIALIAGLYVAANFSEWMATRLSDWLGWEGSGLSYAAFLLTFLAVVFGIYAFAKVVEKAVDLIALKLVNKIMGAVFGLFKVTLILSIVLNLLGWLDEHIPILSQSEPHKSLLFDPVQSLAPTILPVIIETEWMEKTENLMAPLLDEAPTRE